MTLFATIIHFLVLSRDPSWSCSLTHRDPGVRATYYLYCEQELPDGTDIVSVGRFVPDGATP